MVVTRQILDPSKLKEFADNNFKIDENGQNFSKRVENNVGNGEIARYEQFLLFSQCFLAFSKQILIFGLHLFCHMQMLLTWTSLEICPLVKIKR